VDPAAAHGDGNQIDAFSNMLNRRAVPISAPDCHSRPATSPSAWTKELLRQRRDCGSVPERLSRGLTALVTSGRYIGVVVKTDRERLPFFGGLLVSNKVQPGHGFTSEPISFIHRQVTAALHT